MLTDHSAVTDFHRIVIFYPIFHRNGRGECADLAVIRAAVRKEPSS